MCMAEAIAHEPQRFPYATRGCGGAHMRLSLVPVPRSASGETPPLFPRGQAPSLGVTVASACMVHHAASHPISPPRHRRFTFTSLSCIDNPNVPLMSCRPGWIASALKFGRAGCVQNLKALRPQSQSNSDAGASELSCDLWTGSIKIIACSN